MRRILDHREQTVAEQQVAGSGAGCGEKPHKEVSAVWNWLSGPVLPLAVLAGLVAFAALSVAKVFKQAAAGRVETVAAGVMHLTHHDHDVEASGSDSPDGDVEVTPEMIEAGYEAWVGARYAYASEEEALVSAFKAMLIRGRVGATVSGDRDALASRKACLSGCRTTERWSVK